MGLSGDNGGCRQKKRRQVESTHDNLRNEAYLRRGQYVSIVGNPRVILILSFIARGSALWRSLVFNQICMTSVTSSYLVKLHVMYACCSVSDQAWFSNQHGGINMCCYEMLWRSVLFYSCYMLDDWDSTSKGIYRLIWLSVKGFWWFLLLWV